MSAAASSRRTSGSYSRAPLVSTATGIGLMALISRMMRPNPRFKVGSPDPARVMTSGLTPGSLR